MTNKTLTTTLQKIANQKEDTLEKRVAQEALEHSDSKIFFSDLLQFGCVSGMIDFLVYAQDTEEFYDTFYNQIESLRKAYESEVGMIIENDFNLKNTYAWFSFEQTAYNMAMEFGLEI